MNVLVACEESQRVAMSFRDKGHYAFSCDVLPCSGGHPEYHIQGDALEILNGGDFVTMDGRKHHADKWDLLIAHPPCTRLNLQMLWSLLLHGARAGATVTNTEDNIKVCLLQTELKTVQKHFQAWQKPWPINGGKEVGNDKRTFGAIPRHLRGNRRA